jgi:hypothetical protein
MAKIFRLRAASTAALRERKGTLLVHLHVPAHAVRASCVEQYVTCGKSNCRCRRGRKHGPFHYLVQCVHTGNVQKFLLKTAGQRDEARAAVAAYAEFQEKMEELSQINAELLRRGEPLMA